MLLSREIHVVWVGRPERGGWEELCSEYRRRVRHFRPIQDRAVRGRGVKDDRARRQSEEEALTAALPDRAWIIALDRRAKQVTSIRFARRLAELEHSWPHPLVFVIGSDLGLGPSLLERANERLSLGAMTLPHQLARLVLYEQLYRALSIAAGIKYHREPL